MRKQAQRELSRCLETIYQAQRRSSSQAASASVEVAAACLLERLPVVTPEDPKWQTEYDTWQQQILKRYRKELPIGFPDAEAAGGSEWQPAPRTTEADRINDTTSLQRKLDRRLFLLLRCQGSSSSEERWELPSQPHRTGETIRQAAERALLQAIGNEPEFKTYFVGNAPCAHWSSESRTTFIHKAQLIRGSVAVAAASGYASLAWLSREEVLDAVQDTSLNALFQKLLPKL